MQREAFKVKSGAEYDHLFPKALMTTVVTKKGATVADTIKLIPKIVNETKWQAEKFAAFIKGNTLEETCRNIWDFVYNHIAYRKDDEGKEQVRSFARAWNDRHNFLKDPRGGFLKDENGDKIPGGVDCDCMTTFISTTLSVLKIKHALRIVKFWQDHYQHIYPIVYLPGGGHITLDCVVNNFNYEEPYSEKKDTTMDLEYLNGVYDSNKNRTVDSIDMAGSNEYSNDISGLGKLFKKASGGGAHKSGPIKKVFQKGGLKQVVKNTTQNVKATVQAVKSGNLKDAAKRFINLTNKINPGTIPIRAGILAALKTNFFKIAQRLKYAYLNDTEAQKRGVDMGKLSRLRQIRDKLENTFYSMGGNKDNFKEAILTGRGNRDKDVVAGLGYVSQDLNKMRMDVPISQLLGSEMYNDENIHGVEGLGEVATAAVIAAATGILGAIAVLLKQVGSMFPKKSKENQDFENIDGEGAKTTEEASVNTETNPTQQTNTFSSDSFNTTSNVDSGTKNESETVQTRNSSSTTTPTRNLDTNSNNSSSTFTNDEGNNTSNTPATNQSDSSTEDASNNTPAVNNNSSESVAKLEKSFWQKNKVWIIPSSVGLGLLIITGVSYKLLNKPDGTKLQYATHGLNGVPKSRKKRKKKGGHKPKIKSKKKKAVAFI